MQARLLAGVSAAVIVTSTAAFAPSAIAAQATQANGPVSLQEVIVTAQKREQRLEDVPVAVSVLGAQQLQQLGSHSVKDITLLTPGFNATTNADEATTTVRIRGIGSVADNPGLEDAVGIYIDGVYRPRNSVGFNSLGELSDIEVLKGPQGTLFGKNTVAGVVQINTQRPSFTFGAQAEADVQNYDGYSLSGDVTGPLVKDVLAGRLFFQTVTRDGYIPMFGPGGNRLADANDEHFWSLRGQLLYAPTDTFRVNVIADYTERKDHCCEAVAFQNGFPAEILDELFPGSVVSPVTKDNTTGITNMMPYEHIRDEGVSAQVDWTTPWLNGAKFTSITALRDWRDAATGDVDFTGADILNTFPDDITNFRQFSEEVRYAGAAGRLNWLVGAFYSNEALEVIAPLSYGVDATELFDALLNPGVVGPLSPDLFPGDPFPVGEGARDAYHQREHSESVFTEEDFKILDNLILTAGIRFTSEHKSLVSNYNNSDTSGTCAYFEAVAEANDIPAIKATLPLQCLNNPAFFGLNTFQQFTENDVTGTVKLTYHFNPNTMVYASYSRGNLVGGFNLAEVTTAIGPNPNASLTPLTDTFFPAEYVNAFEVGSKAELMNRRLLLTVAGFYQKYQNFQLNAFTGTEFVESTIPDAIAEGIETEDYWRVSPDLTLNFGVTYANTVYTNSLANQEALGSTNPASPFYQATPLFRLPGSHPSFAPVWSIVGGVYFQHDILDGLRFTATANAKYQSSYNTGSDHDPVKDQRGYALVDGRVGLGSANGHWSVEIWATNLFNQKYHQAAFDGVLQTLSTPQPSSVPGLDDYDVFPGQPRFWGATLRVKY